MGIKTITITDEEARKVFARTEGHFLDFKAKEIAPGKVTVSLSAFANADGGELFIGIAEPTAGQFEWKGFPTVEAANGHIQCFESLFPLGQDSTYEFLQRSAGDLVLHLTIQKTRDIKRAQNGSPYIRRGAQNLPVDTTEKLRNLERAKGIASFEDEPLAAASKHEITNSTVALGFMLEVVPHSEPEAWLRKQQLLSADRPTVAGTLLFSEEPQVHLPKAAIKIYRYKTDAPEGTRDNLAFDPIGIEGPIYAVISQAVERTVALAEEIQIMTDEGLRPIEYPRESLHEIITNGVLHRDYALNDDVHVRIFDNRIEVESPGRLPAHITPANILDERFARNPKLVRIVNKFPNPPNKDVGEGLNTAFRAMRKLRLREPQILERPNSVLVSLRHEKLASPEQQIIALAKEQGTVSNSQARIAIGVDSEVKVRALLQKLVKAGELEQVPGTARATSAYRIPAGRPGST